MSNILPIFSSHYSVGRSILTLEDPSKIKTDEGPDSIFSILKEENINQLILLEDNMRSDIESFRYCEKNNIQLIYGVRVYVNDLTFEAKKDLRKHRLCIFARNSQGIFDLRKLFNAFSLKEDLFFTSDEIKKYWTDNLKLVIPFYDSFLFYNTLTFTNMIFELDFYKDVEFFIEDNHLGFDFILKNIVEKFCKDKYLISNVKSIYYKKEEDIDAYLTYKIACSRSLYGKPKTLEEPGIDNFTSNEFCIESWRKKNKC